MLDADEKLYDLLLTEKKLADDQIGDYGDLSLKVLGFFGGTVAVLGWLYSERGIAAEHHVAAGTICIAVVLLGCGVILQGITTYGFTLGYIQYKHETLNRAFVRLANITRQYPFNHVRSWWYGAARVPVLLASLGFVVLHGFLSLGLIGVAIYEFGRNTCWWCYPLAVFAMIGLCYTWYVEYRLYVAIERVFHIKLSLPPDAHEEHDITTDV